MNSATPVIIAVDIMGSDGGMEATLGGCLRYLQNHATTRLILCGNEQKISAFPIAGELRSQFADRMELHHCEDVVTMTDKPMLMVRRGRNTSMWHAIELVKKGEAGAVVSCGNTGVLMAMSVLQLRMLAGIERPAITAQWPSNRGRCVVLDVGANVEASANQLVQFAIMGEAFFRAIEGKEKPSVGLLNVGAEELKGHELIRTAAKILREADPNMAFHGFVEGDDIAKGTVDVIVTDGFTGNITLKTAEGTARVIGAWIKDVMTQSLITKFGAALMMGGLKKMRARMDPSNVNGAPLLGLNGLVIKSHGSADETGFCSALEIADSLVRHPFQEEIKATIAKVRERAVKVQTEEKEVV
jgi:phosphate acyltransferase